MILFLMQVFFLKFCYFFLRSREGIQQAHWPDHTFAGVSPLAKCHAIKGRFSEKFLCKGAVLCSYKQF